MYSVHLLYLILLTYIDRLIVQERKTVAARILVVYWLVNYQFIHDSNVSIQQGVSLKDNLYNIQLILCSKLCLKI